MYANTPNKPKLKQEGEVSPMIVNLPAVAIVFDGFGISDRAAAIITSAVLQDDVMSHM